jgi:hypothetical protein
MRLFETIDALTWKMMQEAVLVVGVQTPRRPSICALVKDLGT